LYAREYDKHDQQGKAAFNEDFLRLPHDTNDTVVSIKYKKLNQQGNVAFNERFPNTWPPARSPAEE
jgi:hypothetical protein